MFRVTSRAKQIASPLILIDVANFGRKLAYLKLIPVLWNMNALRQIKKYLTFIFGIIFKRLYCVLWKPLKIFIAVFKYYNIS